ncbi:MAG: hypothetical protein C0608_10070 [Deltaproteobacteria bacterium]|nr:MAG: hypothetical protein C0608_10070 [Deltaproteobacteria bacterium]
MLNNRLKLQMMTCMAVLIAICSTVLACNLPGDFVEFAEKKGLSPIEGFFDRPGMIEAPFVYGYLPGEKEDSAAFWAKAKSDGEFLLVVWASVDFPPEYSCSETIPWRNFPGGLSIVDGERMPLADFVYVSDPSKAGPADKSTTHNSIMSYYDGVEAIFYCHEGHWLVRQRD